MKRKLKLLIVFFIITLSLFWGLAVLADNYEWALPIFAVVAFPFSVISISFGHYCLSLNDPNCCLPINDEITSGLLFLLSVACQTWIYYWIYNKCIDVFKEYRKKK